MLVLGVGTEKNLELLSRSSQIQSKQARVVAAIGSKHVEILNRSLADAKKKKICIQGKAGEIPERDIS